MKKILFAAAVFLFLTQNVFAQDAVGKIKLGFDGLARIRYEFLNNNSSLGSYNDEHGYFRFKFSGGVSADFFNIFSVYGKLTTESRSYTYNANADARYDISEFLIDSLFINIPKLFGVLDIKAGRMDLPMSEYGEGFLIGDGTPLDGSRTYYFNAARFRYAVMPRTNIEFMTIYNPEIDDFPVMNSQDKKLNDSQESAAVIYARSQLTNKLYIEPYYIWKTEKAEQNPARQHQKDISVNTFGSYLKYDLNTIAFRAQAAAQIGNYDDEIGRAFGGYVYADLPLLNIFKPLSVGYIYLSGDDPDTKAVEAWNPLFSRYPWISELLVMLYSRETAVGYWTNLQLARLEATFKPYEKISINATYDFIYANTAMQPNDIFGSGLNRGNLIRCKVAYNFTNKISAYVLGEYFIPGDFYSKDAEDASFLRLEFSAKL
ncbi:MAG: alginate export family protein [Endomicrobium sp.]|jgi:hypothetical protein|nr:alginate export family protein [Endomicrobium sp.]